MTYTQITHYDHILDMVLLPFMLPKQLHYDNKYDDKRGSDT